MVDRAVDTTILKQYDRIVVTRCISTGGYYEEAKRVARASERHAAVVDICMHHSDETEQASSSSGTGGFSTGRGPGKASVSSGGNEALRYIKSLPRVERALLLQQHGKALISKFGLEMEVSGSLSSPHANKCYVCSSEVYRSRANKMCSSWTLIVESARFFTKLEDKSRAEACERKERHNLVNFTIIRRSATYISLTI